MGPWQGQVALGGGQSGRFEWTEPGTGMKCGSGGEMGHRKVGSAMIVLLVACACTPLCAAEPPALRAATPAPPLRIRDDGVRVTVTSAAEPGWEAIIDRRKGGVITDFRVPATGENLAAADGTRFEGLCNLVYVDFEELPQPGKDRAYLAKGSYSYFATETRVSVEEKTPERVVVVVAGKAGNQVRPRADVVKYRQKYIFLPDRIVCEGSLEWLFDSIVPGSHPELIQPNCDFALGAVVGEMRIWDRDTGPVPLPQTNSKGANLPAGIDYPFTVELPLRGGHAVRIHSLDFHKDFIQARFYYNEFPHQIDGKRGFAFKAWEGWPGNGEVHFGKDETISYSYELVVATAPLPPQSPVISKLTWDPPSTIVREARGSDNWPITWADDGELYAAYGDGNGFEPFVPEKLSLGLAKISGQPGAFHATNLRSSGIEQSGHGAAGKKASGLLMVDGVLYMWVRNAGNSTLAWSADHGMTWSWTDWKWTTSFGCPTFLNFGANYAGARDEYVYVYAPDSDSAYLPAGRMVLARVPKHALRERGAYEFLKSVDAQGAPHWTNKIEERGAVFVAPAKSPRTSVSYDAGLKRYLWCQVYPGRNEVHESRHQGGLGIFDAPEPWGPWTTAFFTEDWDVGPGDTSSLPTKWMSADGRSVHLVFSGDDCFSVRRGQFTTAE